MLFIEIEEKSVWMLTLQFCWKDKWNLQICGKQALMLPEETASFPPI